MHEAQTNQMGAENEAGLEQLRSALNPKMVEAQAKAQESESTTSILQDLHTSQQQQTQTIIAALTDLAKALTAPREFVRDPKTGKAVGSRISQ